MKYKNTKTGVVIDVDSAICGGDWVKFNDIKDNKDPVEEYVEEEINLESMTNKELEEFAKKEGIKLATEDKKNKGTLIATIVAAFEER
uniref:HeH/LEM domain n=1 Tax=Siphoviridae sp. ctwrX9 TaxID=2825735 RepID=A0A8S5PU35_9CAUD|nr:MAG TPA: HeH/LEM domain [Siphoviridae sp. ctwrX9]